MKKNIFIVAVILIALVTVNIKASKTENNKSINLLEISTGVTADAECIGEPGNNNGTCVGNGLGSFFCGNSSWYQSYDCVKGKG